MQGVVYVNGRISPAAEATIPVFDHGFLYGEGVYETLRTYHRRSFLFAEHMARLRRSASMIALTVPFSDDDLEQEIEKTAAACDGDELYIRVLLTRGIGDLSYNLSATPSPSLVIIIKPLPVFPAKNYSEGIRLTLVSIRRNHPHALNPLIKSNNLLNNALAMQEAYRRGADEALMLNQAGHVVECSQSNVFAVKDGRVLTPPLSAGLLPGITREFVLSLARELGIPAEERQLESSDMLGAAEVFITGTTREITPVSTIDDTTIGASTPGPVTSRLMAAFLASTRT